MLRIRVCIVLAVVGLSLPATALAHHAANRSERSTILAAAVHQGEISSTQAVCQKVTVSTANRRYASLTWPVKLSRACVRVAANGVIVEHRTGSLWHLVAAGSSFQCPIKAVPTPVARDLGLCG